MKLRILHRTEYRYALPVRNNVNELRVTPLNNPRQKLGLHLVRVLPAVRMHRYPDLYRNPVHRFEIEEAHKDLVIDVSSVVETLPTPVAGVPTDIPLAVLQDPEIVESFQPYLQSDGPVQVTPEIWRAAVDVERERRDVFSTILGLMEYVHATSKYTPGATHIGTTTPEFFADRRGVCQDYAHLLLALARAIALPARYVCGYVYDAKRGDVIGSHASHAWCEFWVPGYGWLGVDPTNKRLINEAYVASAVGRDYRDATPVSGTYWGSGDREMRVTVHVESK
ncbi:MAG: transglutaminase family protein [Verrucomicrobia bacterium]|nr:transglutaminase family protein [Verrucomicrobiota bacterium]